MLLSRRLLSRAALSSSLRKEPNHRCLQGDCDGIVRRALNNPGQTCFYASACTEEAITPRPSDQFRSKHKKQSSHASLSSKNGRGEIALYDAIVHDGTPAFKIRQHVGEVCVEQDGSAANLKLDEEFVEKLGKLYEAKDAVGAVRLLGEIRSLGLAPTAGAFLRVIGICSSALEFDLAEDVLENFEPSHGAYEKPDVVLCSARSNIARAYLGNDRPNDALHVLGYFSNAREKNLASCLDAMNLGHDDMAWGCLIRALTAAKIPAQAVAVGKEAMQRGIVMSESLVFFLLEAFRALSRWEEADSFFRSAMNNGTPPHERTVGSLLRTLTAPNTRRFVDHARIVELTRLSEEPSNRFRVVSLVALASIGEVKEAKKVFKTLETTSETGYADERAFSILIGSYASYLEHGPPDHVSDTEIRRWYAEFNASLDKSWEAYMERYKNVAPSKNAKEARSRAFQRYLWSKSTAMLCDEAANALEEALNDQTRRKWLCIGPAHFAAVLTGVERTCNTAVLKRVNDLMEREGLPHDHRSLAFCISAMLGQGDTSGALLFVSQHLPDLVTPHALEHQRAYRVKLLLRRLHMLLQSVHESGVDRKGVRGLRDACRRLEAHLEFSSNDKKGWR